jgi:nucleotide-binding universal stress UspA family protein
MYARILVPVDGSPTSRLGVAEAVKLGLLTGGRIKFLHAIDLLSLAAVPEFGMTATPQLLDMLRESGRAILAAAKETAARAGVASDTVLADNLAGRVCDLVIDEAKAWDADIVVIGTHGRRGVGRLLLGSDAEQIVRLSPVPVLLVRAKAADELPRGR